MKSQRRFCWALGKLPFNFIRPSGDVVYQNLPLIFSPICILLCNSLLCIIFASLIQTIIPKLVLNWEKNDLPKIMLAKKKKKMFSGICYFCIEQS